MRILLLSTSMGMGGADKLLLFAGQDMRSRGHEVLIVSLTALGPMGLEARSIGLPTESLEMRRGFPDPRGLIRLIKLVRAWRPDVLHTHMIHANLMARVLRLLVPVPALVSTIHNIYEGGPLRMAAYRLTNGLVDAMTIVSQAAADRFVTDRIVPKDLLRVIPNGLDTEPYQNVPAGADGSSPARTIPTCCAPSRGFASGIWERLSCWSAAGRFKGRPRSWLRPWAWAMVCDSSESGRMFRTS
jgi:glycosyltransferase involved in cell wall biosynthesis